MMTDRKEEIIDEENGEAREDVVNLLPLDYARQMDEMSRRIQILEEGSMRRLDRMMVEENKAGIEDQEESAALLPVQHPTASCDVHFRDTSQTAFNETNDEDGNAHPISQEEESTRMDEVMLLRGKVQSLEEKVVVMEAKLNERAFLPSNFPDHQQNVPSFDANDNTIRMRSTIAFRNFNFSTIKRGLDEDTFALMTISHPNSSPWILGMVAFIFQVTLGVMIGIDQIKEGAGSSIFNIPFRVDPVVRVGQAFTIILCLSTQSDMLSAIQCFILMKKNSTNWHECIGHNGDASARSWYIRIAVPNSLKLIQGILVIFVSFVIIVQSDNIIDLLKDFTALMVLSETDNILFQLAHMGFLGQYLQTQAANVMEVEIEEEEDEYKSAGEHPVNNSNASFGTFAFVRSFRRSKKSFRIRYIGLSLVFIASLSLWGVIVYNQENGTFFKQKYPNCTSDGMTETQMFQLAKTHFGDDKCYGGPLNTLGCKFEGGDCIDFNLAYPLCKGDRFENVQEKLENKICDLDMDKKECDFDGGQCCSFSIIKDPSFGDKQCNGGEMNTEKCHYDDGDCSAFFDEFPNCNLDDIAKMEGSSKIILGDGICDGAVYTNAECGFEFRDCNVGQVGQDVTFRGVSLGSALAFQSMMSNDGSKLMIGMSRTDANDVYNMTSPGKVKLFGYDSEVKLWLNSSNDLLGNDKSEMFGSAVAMSGDGDRIAVGISNYLDGKGGVKVYGFDSSLDGWVQVGNDITDPFRKHKRTAGMGYRVDMTNDGSRVAISSPTARSLNRDVVWAGSIQVYEMETVGEKWKIVGNEIVGKEADVIGFFYVRINSLGTRVYFSAGFYDRSAVALKSYEYKGGEWTQLGTEIQTPHPQNNARPAISADGTRIAVSSYTAADSLVPGSVRVFNLDENITVPEWKELEVPIESDQKKVADGFGYSIDMSADGNLLAISTLDSDCIGNPIWCSTGSIRLYRYSIKNPPHRIFSRVPWKKDGDFSNVMRAIERRKDTHIFGWDISLSEDGSMISVSGYDYDRAHGFVKVYNVDDIFYLDCMVHNPEEIGDGSCRESAPYYTEECLWDGGDCPPPSPVSEYPKCYVRAPTKIGDGTCEDYYPNNTKECGYDGGDCAEPTKVDGYSECYVSNPQRINGERCWDGLPYVSMECGFDGGACID